MSETSFTFRREAEERPILDGRRPLAAGREEPLVLDSQRPSAWREAPAERLETPPLGPLYLDRPPARPPRRRQSGRGLPLVAATLLTFVLGAAGGALFLEPPPAMRETIRSLLPGLSAAPPAPPAAPAELVLETGPATPDVMAAAPDVAAELAAVAAAAAQAAEEPPVVPPVAPVAAAPAEPAPPPKATPKPKPKPAPTVRKASAPPAKPAVVTAARSSETAPLDLDALERSLR